MKIGIIGYRRHASKHIFTLQNKLNIDNLIIFHPSKKAKGITNYFESLFECDGIIVSSPTETHLCYIAKLANAGYKGKIYLEKPGFINLEESYTLENLQSNHELDIRIGYHYPYQSKIQRLQQLINEEDIGKPISIDIVMAKGISYKDWFESDWRSKDKLAICHTGLCHSLSIYSLLTQSFEYESIDSMVYYNQDSGYYDTAMAISYNKMPVFKSIFSWGAPLIECKINIITTNSLITLESNTLTVKKPRDSFDKKGNFTSPKVIAKEIYHDEGIEPSLREFILSIATQEKVDSLDFKRSISIGRKCLSARLIQNI